MIIDTISNVATSAILFIIGLLPNIDLGYQLAGFCDWTIGIFNSINYFIPLPFLLGILGAKIALRYAWAIKNLLLLIWDALPFL